MLNKVFYEIECGYRFHDQSVVLMAVIMKRDRSTIITVNTGDGYDRFAKIPADIFSHSHGVTFIRFCVNIETIFVVCVDRGFDILERRTDFWFQLIQKCSLESVPHETVAEVWTGTPQACFQCRHQR